MAHLDFDCVTSFVCLGWCGCHPAELPCRTQGAQAATEPVGIVHPHIGSLSVATDQLHPLHRIANTTSVSRVHCHCYFLALVSGVHVTATIVGCLRTSGSRQLLFAVAAAVTAVAVLQGLLSMLPLPAPSCLTCYISTHAILSLGPRERTAIADLVLACAA